MAQPEITMPDRGIRYRIERGIIEPLKIIYANKRAFVGLLILAFFAVMALLGPIFIELDDERKFSERYQGISAEHPLGTDFQGRDTFSLLVHGATETLGTALLVGVFTTLLGIVIGMSAGLLGGRIDSVLMIAINTVLTVPYLPIQLILGATFSFRDPFSLALVLSAWAWGPLARAVRSSVLSLKEREFIEAARVLNLSTRHIIFNELVPNVMPFIVINFLFAVRSGITASVALMYLGLIPMDPKNWGMILSDATGRSGAVQVSAFNPNALIYVLSPIGAIVLFQLGIIFLSHGLDEVLDPRLRSHGS
jgi:peptide/nickel transport system permease protein